jgi:hypothetical protein
MKTPTTSRRLRLALAGALLGASLGAQAHQIWFEREGKTLSFRYGELDVNMHEVSPGGLDRFGQLTATRLKRSGQEQPLLLQKRADSFALPDLTALPTQGETFIAIDKRYPMFDTKREGRALRTYWIPATRWVADLQAYAPKLPLDIVPTGVNRGDSSEFQVVFHDEPLPGAKLSVVTPSGWTLQVSSNIDGKFSVALPWKGNYVIGLYYVDDASGERQGPQGSEAYELEGYNSALSFYRTQGLAPLPKAARTLPASVLAEMARAKAAAAAAAAGDKK